MRREIGHPEEIPPGAEDSAALLRNIVEIISRKSACLLYTSPLSGATVCDYAHRSGKPENVEVVFRMDNEKFFRMVEESAANLK